MSCESRLGEVTTPDEYLWKTYWGSVLESADLNIYDKPRLLFEIARTLVSSDRSSHILVSGRYGTGKTSFMKALAQLIPAFADNHSEQPQVFQLWLNMPLITANRHVSAQAAVISQIVNRICFQSTKERLKYSPDKLKIPVPDLPVGIEGFGPSDRNHQCTLLEQELGRTVEDLIQSEMSLDPFPRIQSDSSPEAPAPSRLAGTISNASHAVRRDQMGQIEHLIDLRLGWINEQSKGCKLIVFLDDVDRCAQHVPEQILRILLRFHCGMGIRLVISSDWELMERGVQAWMDREGISSDGKIFVTANSALEKYFEYRVVIPGLGETPLSMPRMESDLEITPQPQPTSPQAEPLADNRKRMMDILVREKDRREPTDSGHRGVIDICTYPSAQSRILADYFLTWLLEEIEEKEVDNDPKLRIVPASKSSNQPGDSERQADPSISLPLPSGHQDRSSVEPAQKNIERPAKENERKIDEFSHSHEMQLFFFLTPFGKCLRKLAEAEPNLETSDDHQILRFKDAYRSIMGMLTPRQLKYYLRQVLNGAVRPGEEPADTLLKQLFHVFGRMITEEEDVLNLICMKAAQLVSLRESQALRQVNSQYPTNSNDLAGRDLLDFYQYLEGLANLSHLLSAGGLKRVWPHQQEERSLLIYLLAHRHTHGQQNVSPKLVTPSHPIGKPDIGFSRWVRSAIGRSLPVSTSDDIATQVEAFHDIVREMSRQGGKQAAFDAIQYYVQNYLDQHKSYYRADMAGRFSNLAVLLDENEGYEREVDRLFSEAHRLQPRHESIPFFWADFLLAVANEPSRQLRLIDAVYPSLDALLQKAGALIENGRQNGISDDESHFYMAILSLLKDQAQLSNGGLNVKPDQIQEQCTLLIQQQMPLLLRAARNLNNVIYGRLDTLLDQLVGRQPSDLMRKGYLYGLIWGVADTCRAPSWPAVRMLANNYVAQSRSDSTQETIGLRLSLALLRRPELIQIPASSAIWTQMLLFWSKKISGQTLASEAEATRRRSRAALGLSLALRCGPGPEWGTRAFTIWQRFVPEAESTPTPQILANAFSIEERELYERLPANLSEIGADLAIDLVEAIVAQDLGQPIQTLSQFLQEDGWQVSAQRKLEEHIDRLARVNQMSDLNSQTPDPSAMGKQSSTDDVAISAISQLDFASWANERIGVTFPESMDIATQVSTFSECVLQIFGQGLKEPAASLIQLYVQQYLDGQMRFFHAETAEVLSTLADLISSEEGFEEEAHRLFSAAHRLQPRHELIPLSWAEFLLEVANQPQRQQPLTNKSYDNLLALLDKAQNLIDTASMGRSPDQETRFYLAILTLLKEEAEASNGGQLLDSQRIDASCTTLIVEHMLFLLNSARNVHSQAFRRLDHLLDQVIGQEPSELTRKARLFGLIWGVAEVCQAPTWPVVRMLANNYVGQSLSRSPQERLGLRLNLGLLRQPDLILQSIAGPIWTQTLLIWSRMLSDQPPSQAEESDHRRSRAALGLLLASQCGDRADWVARAPLILQQSPDEQRIDLTPDLVRQALSPSDQEHYQQFLSNLENVDAALATELLNRVFGEDLGSPISLLVDFIKEDCWLEAQQSQLQQEIQQLAQKLGPI
jgi:hypothetical protein